MTNDKLNKLLRILDQNEISLDITEEELIELPDNLIGKLENCQFKTDIITILLEEIKMLKDKKIRTRRIFK